MDKLQLVSFHVVERSNTHVISITLLKSSQPEVILWVSSRERTSLSRRLDHLMDPAAKLVVEAQNKNNNNNARIIS